MKSWLMSDNGRRVGWAMAAACALAWGPVPAAGCEADEESLLQMLDEAARSVLSADREEVDDALHFLRSAGPMGLEMFRSTYEADLADPEPQDAARVKRLREIADDLAQQRDADRAWLFWFRDLDQAKEAAAESGKPIVSLRMLGALTDEASCANSRLFRTTLYCDPTVNGVLQNEAVLHWESVGEAPMVTVAFADGRRLRRPMVGNSAHVVMDAQGRPVDVLPGLYGPQTFAAELRTSLALAQRVSGLDDEAFRTEVAAHHQQRNVQAAAAQAQLGAASLVPIRSSAEQAQNWTASKRAVELPLLRAVEGPALPGDPTRARAALAAGGGDARFRSFLAETLSEASRTLLTEKTELQGTALEVALDAVTGRIQDDTLMNELWVRPKIHAALAQEMRPLPALNAWLYADVFGIDLNDPWLGLAPTSALSALDGDGIEPALTPPDGIDLSLLR